MTKGWKGESKRHSEVQRKSNKVEYKKKIGAWVIETDLSIYDESLHHNTNPHRKYDFKLVWKTPDQELMHQYKQTSGYAKNGLKGFERWKEIAYELQPNYRKEFLYKNIKRGVGGKVPIIVEEYKEDGSVYNFQEGRTRSLIAKELGAKRIPILQAFKRKRPDDY